MKIRIVVTLLVVFPVSGVAAHQVQSPEALFASALHQEEVEGNLEVAIEAYETILAQASTSRGVTGRALLHIGTCYEKLGRTGAREAYERLLLEYADQPRVIVAARERLALLADADPVQAADGVVTRRVGVVEAGDTGGTISADGRYLSFADSPDLAVRDLESGDTRLLTSDGSWGGAAMGWPEVSVVSPDARLVAYNWCTPDFFYELRVIGMDGSNQRVLYRNKEVGNLEPTSWSPDGKTISVVFGRRGGAPRSPSFRRPTGP